MVREQLEARGIANTGVLDAMGEVPRERFVPDRLAPRAYNDEPLPISEGQTISQPYIVAAMIDSALVGPTDRVLEVGTGSGYGAAVLSRVVAEVVSVERHPSLSETAAVRLNALGYDNVEVVVGDGSLGYAERAPYGAVIVTAAGPGVPRALVEQLAEGGRLVMPIERGERSAPHSSDASRWPAWGGGSGRSQVCALDRRPGLARSSEHSNPGPLSTGLTGSDATPSRSRRAAGRDRSRVGRPRRRTAPVQRCGRLASASRHRSSGTPLCR